MSTAERLAAFGDRVEQSSDYPTRGERTLHALDRVSEALVETVGASAPDALLHEIAHAALVLNGEAQRLQNAMLMRTVPHEGMGLAHSVSVAGRAFEARRVLFNATNSAVYGMEAREISDLLRTLAETAASDADAALNDLYKMMGEEETPPVCERCGAGAGDAHGSRCFDE